MRLPAGHKLRISMILTTAILAGELAGGLMANSLIHAWTVSPQMHALSCHALIDDVPLSQAEDIRHRLEDLLASRFDIEHSTIQVECVACEDQDLGVYCATHREHESYVQSKAGQ